jgi:hypothetical protein
MKKFQIFTAIVAVFVVVNFTACKKDKADTDAAAETVADLSYADVSFNDAQTIADEGATTGSVETFRGNGYDGFLTACATVTRDTVSTPRVTTIDFGTTNCLCQDGRNRRGKIIVTHTGRYRDAGTVITTTFDNYYVQDNKIEGTRTVTNMGNNAVGQPYFTIVENGSVIRANGAGTVTWSSNRTRTWTAGFATPIRQDDVYEITGSSSGTSANGNVCSATILSPLVRKMSLECRRHFVAGELKLTIEGRPDRTINFGNGDCDDIATVTVNGETHTITLRR